MAFNQNHPPSHFLGLNSNLGGNLEKGYNDKEPHNLWITVHSSCMCSRCTGSTHFSKNAWFTSLHEEQYKTTFNWSNPIASGSNHERSKRPSNSREPPDRDGPLEGGSPSGPRSSGRWANKNLPYFERHQWSSQQGPPGGDPPGGGPNYCIEQDEH